MSARTMIGSESNVETFMSGRRRRLTSFCNQLKVSDSSRKTDATHCPPLCLLLQSDCDLPRIDACCLVDVSSDLCCCVVGGACCGHHHDKTPRHDADGPTDDDETGGWPEDDDDLEHTHLPHLHLISPRYGKTGASNRCKPTKLAS